MGKANVGKSTFFAAATMKPVDIAGFPFTTITANKGVAYLRSPCVCRELDVEDNPVNSACVNGVRLIPVDIIDCPGLIKGAHQGKGLGNQFLDEVRKADALIVVADAAGATDENGQVLIFNRGAAEILDYLPEEVIGRMTYEEILPYHAVASIREAFDSHLHGPRGKIINLEVGLLDKAQEPIPARVSGTLLFEEHREVGTVLFVEDLREIYRLEKEKEQVQRMAAIGQAVAGLAHYIKNILTGLKGGSYVMNSAMDKADLDLVRKGWQMVEGNIDQIGMIVTDMLIYSSQRIPKYEPIDPNKLVTEVLELMEGRAKTAGVQLTWELQQDLGDVRMDRTAIHRCLLNLVSNAIDACTLEGIVDGSGMVKVKTARQMDGSIRFEISDQSELYVQARQAAWENALAKAEQLAELADVELGAVLTINETSYTPIRYAERAVAETAYAAGVPVEAGTESVQISLQVTWSLQEIAE